MSSNDSTLVLSAKNSSEGTIMSVSSRSDETLVKMLIAHKDDSYIAYIIANVMAEPSKYEWHCELRKYLEKRNYNDDITTAYMDEYHEFMFAVHGADKYWYKFGTKITHCEKKDDDGMTLPAIITVRGARHWFYNGKKHRTDKDANGHTLPSLIDGELLEWRQNGNLYRDDKDEHGMLLPTWISSVGTKYWHFDGRQQRAEICKDPNSIHFGKAMPAVMTKSGIGNEWVYKGGQYTQDALTELLKKEIIWELSKEFGIVEENGGIRITNMKNMEVFIDNNSLFVSFAHKRS